MEPCILIQKVPIKYRLYFKSIFVCTYQWTNHLSTDGLWIRLRNASKSADPVRRLVVRMHGTVSTSLSSCRYNCTGHVTMSNNWSIVALMFIKTNLLPTLWNMWKLLESLTNSTSEQSATKEHACHFYFKSTFTNPKSTLNNPFFWITSMQNDVQQN